MSLTRKDFFSLARSLRSLFNQSELNKLPTEQQDKIQKEILEKIEDFCRSQNGLFDYKRFESEVFKNKE